MAMHDKGVPGFESETPEKQYKELQRIFREVFSSENGRIVFNCLLEDLCYFRTANNADEVALNNYAKVLIKDRMGFIDNISLTEKLLESEHEE